MSAITSQITSLTIVYSTVYSGADKKKHQSSASLVFVQGIHREYTMAQWRHMVSGLLNNIGSGHGLLHGDTKL